MKIVLRKKNSVTSIVLFIYNLHGEILKEYSIKLAHLIDIVNNFGKSETAVRMGLSRMVKAGVLENITIKSDVFYRLTEEGHEYINSWNIGLSYFFERFGKRHDKWDEKWYILNIFQFNKTDIENQFIVEELTGLGMLEVNSGQWICPYNISNDIKNIFMKTNYNYFEIVGDIYSNLDTEKLIRSIYNIKGLEKKYNEFVEFAKKAEIGLENKKTEEKLEILFELGWLFYDAITSDPCLPREIMSKWKGDEAVKNFSELRSRILKEIEDYLNIIKNK